MRRKMDDNVGTRIVQHTPHRLDITQVIVLATGDKDLSRTALVESFDDKGTEEARATRDDNTPILPKITCFNHNTIHAL
jgi:hypothetical protein